MKNHLALCLSAGFVLSACSSSSTGVSFSGLSDLPNPSSMVSANSSGLAVVSGTPPTFGDFVDSESGQATVASAFWGDLFDDFSAPVSETKRQRFHGELDGQEGGEGACRMAESVSRAFQPLLESGTSLCYMKNVPTVAGVTVSPETDRTKLFEQQADDRMVRVIISGEDVAQSIFIVVKGSDSVGAGVYEARLNFCEGTETLTYSGYENISVNRNTGIYSSVVSEDGSFGQRAVNVQASLKSANGAVTFDSTKTRTVNAYFGWSDGSNTGSYKASVDISGSNQMTSKFSSSFSWDNEGDEMTSIEKIYAVSNFSGSDLDSLRFLEGGFKVNAEYGEFEADFSGGTEFQDTHYKATPTSDLATSAAAYNLASDSFYTLTAPEFDSDAFDCNAAEPDFTVELDMSSDAMVPVNAECQANRIEGGNFCWENSIVQANRMEMWQ